MNAGKQIALLGLCTIAFYGILLATGSWSLEIMPQLAVSALIFLSSGRLLKIGISHKEKPVRTGPEPDWPWLTAFLNWAAAFVVIGAMAILLMKPAGLSFSEALHSAPSPQHFHADSIP